MDEQREDGSRQDERQREECGVITERLPKRRRNGNIA